MGKFGFMFIGEFMFVGKFKFMYMENVHAELKTQPPPVAPVTT